MPSTWLGPETLLGGCNDGGLGPVTSERVMSLSISTSNSVSCWALQKPCGCQMLSDAFRCFQEVWLHWTKMDALHPFWQNAAELWDLCLQVIRQRNNGARMGQSDSNCCFLHFSSVFILVIHPSSSFFIYILISRGRCFRSIGVAHLTWSTWPTADRGAQEGKQCKLKSEHFDELLLISPQRVWTCLNCVW